MKDLPYFACLPYAGRRALLSARVCSVAVDGLGRRTAARTLSRQLGRLRRRSRRRRETPAKTDTDPDQATIDQWRKNIDKWKEIDPREAADNSFCYVCHANYEKEKLVNTHEPEGVGCETCHGRSDKHSQDEDSLVPPDVIFASAKVANFCMQCHAKRDLLDGDEAHEKFFAGQVEPDKTCTSCHDMKHTLKVRTRRWDKETRKLEWYGRRAHDAAARQEARGFRCGRPAAQVA